LLSDDLSIFLLAVDEAASTAGALAALATEETTLCRLGAVVFGTRGAAQTEEYGRKEEACESSPLETKSISANVGCLAIRSECISSLDISGSHQRCVESLEKESQGRKDTTEV